MGLQVNTAALFYRKVRMVFAEQLEAETAEFAGQIEIALVDFNFAFLFRDTFHEFVINQQTQLIVCDHDAES
ncbi:MAG: hypothetical protein JKX85_02640 [Phycisphaeraceae bacterium]|nr:hypothetical protein [Phycisphaeraceae bacterium]